MFDKDSFYDTLNFHHPLLNNSTLIINNNAFTRTLVFNLYQLNCINNLGTH